MLLDAGQRALVRVIAGCDEIFESKTNKERVLVLLAGKIALA